MSERSALSSSAMHVMDQRSSPELFVQDLLDRFREREDERAKEDLAALAEDLAGGQLEDAIIELLGASPKDAHDAVVAWCTKSEASGTPRALARRRLDTFRRLCVVAEREFMDAALVAAILEQYGATLAQLLARTMETKAPS